MQVHFRQRQELPKRAGMPHDPEDSSIWTMPSQSSPAPLTLPAGQIDFAYNPAAEKLCIIGFNNFSDEFVAGYA